MPSFGEVQDRVGDLVDGAAFDVATQNVTPPTLATLLDEGHTGKFFFCRAANRIDSYSDAINKLAGRCGVPSNRKPNIENLREAKKVDKPVTMRLLCRLDIAIQAIGAAQPKPNDYAFNNLQAHLQRHYMNGAGCSLPASSVVPSFGKVNEAIVRQFCKTANVSIEQLSTAAFANYHQAMAHPERILHQLFHANEAKVRTVTAQFIELLHDAMTQIAANNGVQAPNKQSLRTLTADRTAEAFRKAHGNVV